MPASHLFAYDDCIFIPLLKVQGSHHRVVQLMQEAGHRGHVTMILRRKVTYYQQPTYNHRIYPYDVIISRNENEGFGFVISSSTQYYGSTIGNAQMTEK